MLFYRDKYSTKSGISQYADFLDAQIYLYKLRQSVPDTTNYQLLEIRKSLAKNSLQTSGSIERSIINVCGTLENGFTQINTELYKITQGIDDVNWKLTELNEGIHELYSLFDERTQQIIEQQKITNNILQALVRIASLPDFSKESAYFNKMGNGYLAMAVREDAKSNFYDEALEAFNNAYKANKYDYVSQWQIGFIMLNSKTHLDVSAAKEFFVKSSTNALIHDDEKSKNVIASSFYYEAICSYILGDLPAAITSIKKASSLYPTNLKYKFQTAKYLAANGDEVEAVPILMDIMWIEPLYSVEILKDQDLISDLSVQNMFEQELYRVTDKVDKELNKIKMFLASNPHSHSEQLIRDIEKDYNSKTYLTARAAMKKLKI